VRCTYRRKYGGAGAAVKLRMFKRIFRSLIGIGCAVLALSAGACVSSRVVVGNTHAPLLPGQVRLYLEAPEGKYEQIAIIDTSSKYSFSFTPQAKADVVIRRLKEEAAKLGANGILLQEVADEPVGSIGTGVGTEYTGTHGSISLGLSGSSLLSQKFGRGIAIYLEPDR
jgi:hypothetical protein